MKIFIKICCTALLLCTISQSQAQQDAAANKIFKALSDSNTFKLNTSAPPADILTKKIKQLRAIRGNFNPNELIKFKLKEEQSKSTEFPPEFYKRLLSEFENGTANAKLTNTIINLYRKYFTVKDIDQLIKFYKTSVGQKMLNDFPLVMLLSIKATEDIMKSASEKVKSDMKNEGLLK